ncbi:MAG: hypothetical protein ABIA59_00490 [Candidatus Latescibacterota bacterium]
MSGKQKHITLGIAVLVCIVLMSDAGQAAAAKLKWYEGGTLHKRPALEWQKASYNNKLATCADFVAHAWINKMLNKKVSKQIHVVDDLKPFAVELVAFIDAATAPEKDPQKNRELFANQTVAELAARGMAMLSWMEK